MTGNIIVGHVAVLPSRPVQARPVTTVDDLQTPDPEVIEAASLAAAAVELVITVSAVDRVVAGAAVELLVDVAVGADYDLVAGQAG